MTSPVRAITLGLLLCCLVTWTSSQLNLLPFDINKLGQCPSDVDFPVCTNTSNDIEPNCEIDIPCDGKEKCCYYGCRYRCLLPLEEKTGSCSYYDVSHCINNQPLPDECHDDSQCPGSKRCCCNNCRRQCTTTVRDDAVHNQHTASYRTHYYQHVPSEEHDGFCPRGNEQISCTTMVQAQNCKNDADCNEDEKCCLSDDWIGCVPALTEKAGSCPFFDASDCIQNETLPDLCHKDSQCPGSKRCCCNNCRRECTATVKKSPGFCPGGNEQISCTTKLRKLCCKNDADCVDNEKCCLSNDRMDCVPAVKADLRSCPPSVSIVGGSENDCNNPPSSALCTKDRDCLNTQKCCYDGCVRRCFDT